MRTVIFKAVDIDSGKSVKGDLQRSGKSYYIKENEKWYRVKPETICQFTGLQDIAGEPIYENDRVYIIREGMTSKRPHTVFWDQGIAAFALIDNLKSPGFSQTFSDEDKYVIIPPKQ